MNIEIIDIAWILIAIKMTDVMLVLMHQSFHKDYQRKQSNIKEDKQYEIHKNND